MGLTATVTMGVAVWYASRGNARGNDDEKLKASLRGRDQQRAPRPFQSSSNRNRCRYRQLETSHCYGRTRNAHTYTARLCTHLAVGLIRPLDLHLIPCE